MTVDTSNEACERACRWINAGWGVALIRALCAERDEACTGNEILKAKLSALCEAVVVNDSYGVEGSSFQTCLACGAGGAPGIVFEHTTDCAVGRSEEVSERWFKERSDELKEYEDEEKRLLARAEAAESELSSLRAKGDFVDIVFDGPPGPVAGRFVEVNDANGRSIKFGEWLVNHPTTGYWVLRIPAPQDAKLPAPMEGEVAELVRELRTRKCFFRNGGQWSMSTLDDDDCQRAANALESLSRRNEGDGWQPIETAKKDRLILVYAPEREGLPEMQSLCRWHEDAGFCIDELRTPTHRQPLLPPPKTSKDATPPGPFVGDPGYRSGGDEAAKLHDREMAEVRHNHPAQSSGGAKDAREAFEAWTDDANLDMRRDGSGYYFYLTTARAYESWLAALSWARSSAGPSDAVPVPFISAWKPCDSCTDPMECGSWASCFNQAPSVLAPTGWAIIDNSGLHVRTVSDTRRAAIVNWIVTEKQFILSQAADDESIERYWRRHKGGAQAVEVTIRARSSR